MSAASDRGRRPGGARRDRADRAPTSGPVAVSTVALSLLVWPLAFNLGAYSEVFYEDVFRFVVAAAATLAVVAVSPQDGALSRVTVVALGAPAAWLAAAVLLFDSTAEAASDPVFGTVGLVIAVVAVPTALRVLYRLFNPELSLVDDTRAVIGAAAIVVAAATAGFVVGANNDAFLVCDDFKVAGADQPANCARP